MSFANLRCLFLLWAVCIASMLGAVLATDGILLEAPNLDDDEVNWRLSSIATDGTILVAGKQQFYHYRKTGELINRITQVDDIAAIHYDPHRKMYWVVNYAPQTQFFDIEGNYLGEAFRLNKFGQKMPAYTGQIFQTSERLFVLTFDVPDFWTNPNGQLLWEVDLKVEEGEVLVYQVGSPFFTMTSLQKSFFLNFLRFWLVEGPYHGDLYVANQLSPIVRHFVQHPEIANDKEEVKDKTIYLSLPHYQSAPKGVSTKIKTQRDFERWMSTWSRLQGFYGIDKGFLVVYEVPDLENKGESRTVAQAVNRAGKAVGKLREIDGHHLGVWRNDLYVASQQGQKILLKVMSF